MPATSAEAGDSSAMTPIPSQTPPITKIITQSTVVSAVVEGGSMAEP